MSMSAVHRRCSCSFNEPLNEKRSTQTSGRSDRLLYSRSGQVSRNVQTSQFQARGYETRIVSDSVRGNFKQDSVRISTEESKDSATRHLNLYHSKKRGKEILNSRDFAKLAHSSSEDSMGDNPHSSDGTARTRAVANTMREGVKIIAPSRPDDQEYTFATLLTSLGQVTYNAVWALIQVVLALVPLVGIVLNFMRFFLDKLIGLIDSSGSSTDFSRQIMVFSIQFTLIGILIYYMFSGLFIPMFWMLREVLRKVVFFLN